MAIGEWDPWRVYFIESGPGGPIKIGWSGRGSVVRLADMQVGNPEVLRLLGTCPDDARRTLERALHRELAAHHKLGEWYERTEEVLAAMARCLDPEDKGNTILMEMARTQEAARVARRRGGRGGRGPTRREVKQTWASETVAAWAEESVVITGDREDTARVFDALANFGSWLLFADREESTVSKTAIRAEIVTKVLALGAVWDKHSKMLAGIRLT